MIVLTPDQVARFVVQYYSASSSTEPNRVTLFRMLVLLHLIGAKYHSDARTQRQEESVATCSGRYDFISTHEFTYLLNASRDDAPVGAVNSG